MIEINARMDFTLSPDDMLQRFGLEDGGRVQKIIDKAVIDYSQPYWAFDTGTLARSAYAATVYGEGWNPLGGFQFFRPGRKNADGSNRRFEAPRPCGQVVWPGPYAHYQAKGEVYGPNIPIYDDDSGIPTVYWSKPGEKKHPTGAKLKYKTDVNPLAGAFPIERMKADHTEDILEEIRTMMNDEL